MINLAKSETPAPDAGRLQSAPMTLPFAIDRLPPALRHGLALAAFAVALAGAWWQMPQPAPAGFAAPAAGPSAALPAEGGPLPVSPRPVARPALALLADGRIAAAWLGGEDDEVAVWFSVLDAGGWRAPVAIANRPSTAGGSFAHVRRISQPVLHAEGSWLHFWYLGEMVGDSVHYSLSTDDGRHWSRPQRWPERGIPGLGAPRALTDGGIALPLGSRPADAGGAWLRLDSTGRVVDRIAASGDTTGWPSPDGAPLRLPDGRLLLAGRGDSPALRLWLSDDDGRTWRAGRSLGPAGDGPPALLLGRDGRIHLAYAGSGGREIRHLAFALDWALETAR